MAREQAPIEHKLVRPLRLHIFSPATKETSVKRDTRHFLVCFVKIVTFFYIDLCIRDHAALAKKMGFEYAVLEKKVELVY